MSILGIGLTLLGGGGIIGAVLAFVPGAMAAVTAFVSRIPPKAWLVIGAAALLVTGYFVHRHYAHKALAAEYARGSSDRDAAWQKRFDEMHEAALRWKGKAEAKQTNISQEVKSRHETDLHLIDARAGDQRLRGPGKAAAPACVGPVDPAGLPASPGGHVAAGGNADPGLSGLPPEGGLAIVPWLDLVSAGKLADDNRAEVTAWREWYARQAAANKAARETKPN